MTNDYHFLTHWHIEGRIEEVYDLIANPAEYPRWWKSVYLETRELASGDSRSIGRRFHLHTKGFLPYTLRWESCTVEASRPHRLEIRATGDFNGRGIWMLRRNGPLVDVDFDWKLTAEKPLIRYLSFLFKPLFSANHRWAMNKGQEGLIRELRNRR
jgi:Polyketide cyclase / dehydrase and lipid transport